MSEPFIGEVRIFGGTFAPRGWAACDGQMLSPSQNSGLFAILSTTYGGDGTTFALPDLRGRAPIHRSKHIPQGKGQADVKVTSGATAQPGYLALNFIIAMQGLYPSRA
jgi:microcystin-dependent protein